MEFQNSKLDGARLVGKVTLLATTSMKGPSLDSVFFRSKFFQETGQRIYPILQKLRKYLQFISNPCFLINHSHVFPLLMKTLLIYVLLRSFLPSTLVKKFHKFSFPLSSVSAETCPRETRAPFLSFMHSFLLPLYGIQIILMNLISLIYAFSQHFVLKPLIPNSRRILNFYSN